MFPQPSRSVVVYVAGAYSATSDNPSIQHNINRAREVSFKYWQLGYTVICPHSNTWHMDAAASYDAFVEGTLELLKRCDAIILLKGWELSSGSIGEYKYAKANNIPIRFEE